MAKRQSLINPAAIVLVLWFLTGCASFSGPGSGNDVPRQISLFYENPLATAVCVVGSFNGWTIGADPFVKVGEGKWKGALRLPKGVYQYMYVVNGKTWVTDPQASRVLDDGFGRINGLLVVE